MNPRHPHCKQKLLRAMALLCLVLPCLTACSGTTTRDWNPLPELHAPKPWVKPYQRQNLADPIMSFDRDPVANAYMHHVFQAREGARGAEGGAGGGCGCN